MLTNQIIFDSALAPCHPVTHTINWKVDISYGVRAFALYARLVEINDFGFI